ncbi:MAG TPA: AraD1 family protein [Terriglobales bacterium]|nr:AraD1 family protein [Terriglobales bacterium]
MRLIQLRRGDNRRVGLVEEPKLRMLSSVTSIHQLATEAIASVEKLSAVVQKRLSSETLDYDPIYEGNSEWRILPAVDHPETPSRCLISGTGLTHLGSARGRQQMHISATEELTDSMKMFRWGVEGGRPAPQCVGTPPEWFYKGSGNLLRAHNETLDIPFYGEDGGEEAEIAGVYVIGENGQPFRIGFATGNEFSDHRFEKKNYLNLAGSKLRTCSLGPELTVGAEFQSVAVKASIQRAGKGLWAKSFRTGEAEMCHSLQNIEHHHFKFEGHRRPGDVHVHYFGTDALSFSEGVELEDGDMMEVSCEGFGRPLRNPLKKFAPTKQLISVTALE